MGAGHVDARGGEHAVRLVYLDAGTLPAQARDRRLQVIHRDRGAEKALSARPQGAGYRSFARQWGGQHNGAGTR